MIPDIIKEVPAGQYFSESKNFHWSRMTSKSIDDIAPLGVDANKSKNFLEFTTLKELRRSHSLI